MKEGCYVIDFIIKGGTIIDGSGAPGFKGDIALHKNKIVQISENIKLDSVDIIEARGKIITPGFIDIHRHADGNLFYPSFGDLELRQGLTSIINGNCGLSLIPCPPSYSKEIFSFLQSVVGEVPKDKLFYDFKDYMDLVSTIHLPLNVGMNIGNGTVRAATKGYAVSAFTKEEMHLAQRYLYSALEAGALGVSLGLVYAPENCYTLKELKEVLTPMKNFKVPLVTHIRGEGDMFHESLKEVIDLAASLQVPLHISHLKCIGKRNWGYGVTKALKILDAARASGMHITNDVYPYPAGSTQLLQILPPEYLEGGTSEIIKRLQNPAKRTELKEILKKPQSYFENLVSSIGWENIIMSTLTLEKNQGYVGKNIAQIADLQGKSPFDCALDMLIEEDCKITMVDYIVSEEDIKTILKYPYSSIISDSTYPTGGIPHPRVYGTYPRILQKYVREEKVLTLEEAIHKMTSLPSQVYNLRGKGLLKEGMDADINIFDLNKVETKADFNHPREFATGFSYVFVNGQIAVKDDKLTGFKKGKILERA